MRTRAFLSIILSMILFSVGSAAQDVGKVKAAFKVEMDLARYYGDSTQIFVEVYYGFSEGMLSYTSDSGIYKGSIHFNLEINDSGRVVAEKEWVVPHTVQKVEQLSAPQTLVGLQTFGLPPGEYSVKLLSFDTFEPERRDSLASDLTITLYPTDRECFSDIELCTSIQSSTEKQSLFYKNTLDVVPNPGKLYGTGLPIMYYYAIAYNLLSQPAASSVIVRTAVVDALGNEVIVKDKTKPRMYNASVEIGTVNLSALRTGTYLFRMTLLDTMKTIVAVTEKKFFVYKVGSTIDSLSITPGENILSDKYAVMSEEEVQKNFEYAKYVATEGERVQFEQLSDLKAKQKYLSAFWKRRSMGGEMVPADETYYARVKYANDQYSSGFREGWKSDRGRVYIMYGPVDDIEHFSSSSESNPYEIWNYNNIQGGVIFVFVDRDGLDNFVLVHSTHRAELHEESWYEKYAIKMH